MAAFDRCLAQSHTRGNEHGNTSLISIVFVHAWLLALIQASTADSILSTYSGSFSSNNSIFDRPLGPAGDYYYQVFRLTTDVHALYEFRGNGSVDVDGFYYFAFNPSNSNANILAYDSFCHQSGVFSLSGVVGHNLSYILLVTTCASAATGSYLITATGPGRVRWIPLTMPTLPRPPRTTTTTTTTTRRTSTVLSSSTYGLLSSTSSMFSRPGTSAGYYYYQVFRVRVYVNGTYTFSAVSNVNTYGYFYNEPVDPSIPLLNLIMSDDNGDGNGRFRIDVALQFGRTYALLVTTYDPHTIGNFTINVKGPLAPYMLTPFSPWTSRPVGTTLPPSIDSSFSGGYLSSSSPIFSRPGHWSDFYYQTMRVTITTTGIYSFTSVSTLNTYGCFYMNPVNPSDPYSNLLQSDDDSAGTLQFRINVTLLFGRTYVLLVTTSNPRVTGAFSVSARGPSRVTFTEFQIPTHKPGRSTSLGTILGIIAGCVLLMVIVSVVGRCKNKRQASASSRVHVRAHTQSNGIHEYPMTTISRNPRPTNADRRSPPPSYDAYLASLSPEQRAKEDPSAQMNWF